MSIAQKGWVLVAIPLLAQLAFLAVLLVSHGHHQHAQKVAIQTNKVLGQAEACYRQVLEAQSNMHGYLLTEDAGFFRLYERAQGQLPDDCRKLAKLVEDNPEQHRKVQEITALAGAFLDWMNQNIRLVQTGRRPEALGRVQPASGVNYLHELRKRIGEFLAEERRLEETRVAGLDRAVRLEALVLLAGVVLAFVSSLALLVAFSRSISRRVGTLIGNTRRLADGKELAPPLDGSDELRRLDQVFHEMATAIRQKEQENELFVYSVSHDLRSPLVNLQGFSQELALAVGELRKLLQSDGVPEPVKASAARLIDRDAAEAIGYIQSAVTRLAGIIDGLLRLSRAGRVELAWQDVDVEGIVRRVVAALHNSLEQNQAEVHLGPLPPCWGDPRAVDQIFANLIGNAVHYLDPARAGRIEVGVVEEGPPGFHTYYVKDNGLGIPEGLQAKVFVAFQRLHPDAGPGEGVGLALVRRVVERLGGRAWLTSRPGEGSTFWVTLPASGESRPSVLLARSGPAPPRNGGGETPPTSRGEHQASSAEWQAITPDALAAKRPQAPGSKVGV